MKPSLLAGLTQPTKPPEKPLPGGLRCMACPRRGSMCNRACLRDQPEPVKPKEPER
ncbi:MAG: hypothetical protein PHE09_03335 [Oscillospiraceae bacterium]|nr:hypothetical protein [Oscillospiraceae bacterium]